MNVNLDHQILLALWYGENWDWSSVKIHAWILLAALSWLGENQICHGIKLDGAIPFSIMVQWKLRLILERFYYGTGRSFWVALLGKRLLVCSKIQFKTAYREIDCKRGQGRRPNEIDAIRLWKMGFDYLWASCLITRLWFISLPDILIWSMRRWLVPMLLVKALKVDPWWHISYSSFQCWKDCQLM